MLQKFLFFLLLAFCTQGAIAQPSTKVASKSPCNAIVEVTFFNQSVIPAYQSFQVAVPAFGVVGVSCPTCTGPEWSVCSANVQFTTGASIFILTGLASGCMGTNAQNMPGQCFTSGLYGFSNNTFFYAIQ